MFGKKGYKMNKTDVLNKALILLGQGVIVEPSAEVIINKVYDNVKERLLRSHPWSCALKDYILDHVNDVPPFKFNYMFVIPSDCLRVIANFQENTIAVRKGRYLYSDEPVLKFVGISNIEEAFMSSEVISLLAYDLAIETCMAYTSDKNLKEQLRTEREIMLARAKMNDVKESSEVEVEYNCGWGLR